MRIYKIRYNNALKTHFFVNKLDEDNIEIITNSIVYLVNINNNSCTCNDYKGGDNPLLCVHLIKIIMKISDENNLLKLKEIELKNQLKNYSYPINKFLENITEKCYICLDKDKLQFYECNFCHRCIHVQCLLFWSKLKQTCPHCSTAKIRNIF